MRPSLWVHLLLLHTKTQQTAYLISKSLAEQKQQLYKEEGDVDAVIKHANKSDYSHNVGGDGKKR